MSIAYSGDSITFPDLSVQNTSPTGFGFKNRIINGDMRIDQRNAGAAVTVTTGGGYIYPVDRFGNFNNSGVNYTAEQVEDAPVGFYQSTKLTFASAISLTTQNEATFFQVIEGLNVTDFAWGTANAQTVTVGMWVKASFTGTFSIGFCNDGGTRAYATTYTISAANTWEYKTFIIAGDTSGTWLKTNGVGLFVRWNIVAGSNFNVAANNAWATRTGAYNAADGAYGTKAIGAASSISAGATWQVTGVQLEKGSTATSFDFRDYGRELMMCQRYTYRAVPTVGNGLYGFGNCNDVTSGTVGVQFPVTMRSNPTFTSSAGNTFLAQTFNNNGVPSTIGMQTASSAAASVSFGGAASLGAAGVGAKLLDAGAINSFLQFSAEL